MTNISIELDNIRKEMGLSQMALANLTDIPRCKIQLINSGIEELDGIEISKVKRALVQFAKYKAAYYQQKISQIESVK